MFVVCDISSWYECEYMTSDNYYDLIISTCFYLLAENPYDSIPNFSAADALRLTGIGRNEFIDIMNKCRSKVLEICLYVHVFMVDLIVIQFLNSLYLFKAHVLKYIFSNSLLIEMRLNTC